MKSFLDYTSRVNELLDLRGEDAGGDGGLRQVRQDHLPLAALQRLPVNSSEANVVFLGNMEMV